MSAGLRRAVVVVVFQYGGEGHEEHTRSREHRREHNSNALNVWLSSLEAMATSLGVLLRPAARV